MRLLFILLAFLSVPVFAQEPLWMRYPSLSPDGKTIAFSYKGDLYTVPSAGGRATLLTLHEAHDFMPVWSRDGKSIAFASSRYGNFDVFLIAATGGTAQRLTYHSAHEYPYSFSADNRQILFGSARIDLPSNRQYPVGYLPELYSVPVLGGRVQQLLTTPAEYAQCSRDGKRWLYQDRKGQENAWRKHHTSSVTRDIWLYDATNQTHTIQTTFQGEDRNPLFLPDESGFCYLSEESGSFNVYRKRFQAASSEQLTSFQQHPVRFLSTSNEGLLCFAYDGSIYTLVPGEKPKKVEILLPTDTRSTSENLIPVSGGSGLEVAPNGKEITFIYNGDVFVSNIENGITKQITRTPQQEESVSFAPDGKSLIYSSERNGKWSIYESTILRPEEPFFYASTLIRETPVLENSNSNTQPLYSPDGKEIAYIENRDRLCVYNKKSGTSRTLLTNQQLFSLSENDQYFQWSPDNEWILFQYSIPGSNPGEIGLVRADGSRIENLTKSGFNDSYPKWILGGKGILWFSNRDGLRSVAMSGGGEKDVYALFLTQKAWDDFNLSKEEAKLQKELEEKEKEKETEKEKTKEEKKKDKKKKEVTEKKDTLAIDWEGLELRKAKLTIHSSILGDALISKDGETLYYLAKFEKGMNLWSTSLRTKATQMLHNLDADYGSMTWDKEQEFIYINTPTSFFKADLTGQSLKIIPVNGEMNSDQNQERRAAYEHITRKTRQTFYTSNFHNIDWSAYSTHYEKFLPHISNSFDFSELLSELLGELNVSHSGSGYSLYSEPSDATASLGAFFDPNHTGPGLKVMEIIKGGPLDKQTTRLKTGTIILKIDDDTISADTDYARYLNRKAGKNILLTVNENNQTRAFLVKPISLMEESELLYIRWIKRNADEVDSLSNGRLGYVHIPGMDDGSFRTTFEEILGKHFNKEGIVVDTRYNGGGDLVADLEMFLSGKKFMDYGTENRTNGYEPNFRWTKPSISLINEANYSDGHCYAFMMKLSGIGKLVGMPVPGTCTFGGWEAIMNGAIRWGVPSVGCKDTEGRFLENRQTEPDIQVRNEYEKTSSGIDQQLERAVSELLQSIQR
jgi:Tol biopolymer transport system component/C-terminal processing protease CtpA/Prc